MIHWVEGARRRRALNAGLASRGGGKRARAAAAGDGGVNIHGVYFIAGEIGEGASSKALEACGDGKAKEGGRDCCPKNFPGLRLRDRYTACRPGAASISPPTPSRGGVRRKVTQPSRSPAPVPGAALTRTSPGGKFGDDRVGRSKAGSNQPQPTGGCTARASRGPRPPGAEKSTSFLLRDVCA